MLAYSEICLGRISQEAAVGSKRTQECLVTFIDISIKEQEKSILTRGASKQVWQAASVQERLSCWSSESRQAQSWYRILAPWSKIETLLE